MVQAHNMHVFRAFFYKLWKSALAFTETYLSLPILTGFLHFNADIYMGIDKTKDSDKHYHWYNSLLSLMENHNEGYEISPKNGPSLPLNMWQKGVKIWLKISPKKGITRG